MAWRPTPGDVPVPSLVAGSTRRRLRLEPWTFDTITFGFDGFEPATLDGRTSTATFNITSTSIWTNRSNVDALPELR